MIKDEAVGEIVNVICKNEHLKTWELADKILDRLLDIGMLPPAARVEKRIDILGRKLIDRAANEWEE